MLIRENKDKKFVTSPTYSYMFNKKTGEFARWGRTYNEDPPFSPFGPEILDLEISTGACLGRCQFCYKCNGSGERQNMSYGTFVKIMDVMPRNLTQIAFGITDIHGNPHFFDMMSTARYEYDIIPNYTCHGLDVSKEVAQRTARLCGAVAVSLVNQEKSYDAINMFTDAGMKQVNIHFMLAQETVDKARSVIDDIKKDPRLAGLNAIVFLQYKAKGRSPEAFHSIADVETYRSLIQYCNERGVRCGFDSCSAPLYLKAVEDEEQYPVLSMFAEPCESFGMFSSYINAEGIYFPCSFSEGEAGWETGMSVLDCNSQDDFLERIWHSPRLVEWREKMLHSTDGCDCKSKSHCRTCPIFNVTACKEVYEIRN